MARTRRRTTALTAAALTAAGLLAGCSDEGGPAEAVSPQPSQSATAPEPDRSPSPSPSPSVAEDHRKPTRPAAMDQHDADGAAAAAEYFLSLRSYIMRTGDTAEWETMSHRSCGYCESGLSQAKQRAERGDDFTGGKIDAEVVGAYQRDGANGIWPFDLDVHEGEISITAASGEELFASEPASYRSRVEVGIRDGDWVIVEVAPVPEN